MKPMLSFEVLPCRSELKFRRGRRKHLTPKTPRVRVVKPSSSEIKWISPEFSDLCRSMVVEPHAARKRKVATLQLLPSSSTPRDCCHLNLEKKINPTKPAATSVRTIDHDESVAGNVSCKRDECFTHVLRVTNTPDRHHSPTGKDIFKDTLPTPHTRTRSSAFTYRHPSAGFHPVLASTPNRVSHECPSHTVMHAASLPYPCAVQSYLEDTSFEVHLPTPSSDLSPTHNHQNTTVLADETPPIITPQRTNDYTDHVDCICETPHPL